VIKTKRKGKTKAGKAAPYVRRTLEDKRVHDHLADAAASVRKAYRRASRRGGAEAVEDKKLYDHVRGAAGSLRAAFGIVRQPEPEPPKRRGRKVVLVLAVVGAAGLVAKKRLSKDGAPREYSAERPDEPVEPARATQAA
jgi:hypothetical protein